MIRNKVLQITKEGRVALGAWVDLADPELVEMMGYIGYDFVILEHEHASRTVSQLQELITAADAAQIPTFVRIKENSDSLIQQILDAGAAGIILALTRTKEDAMKAVRASKYPPLGVRGLSITVRSTGFASISISYEEYARQANDHTMVFALIETRDAVDNVTSIASVEGLTGLFFGPGDYSIDAGVPWQVNHPKVIAARDRIAEACKNQRKLLWLLIFDPAQAKDLVRLGARILVTLPSRYLLRDFYEEYLQRMKASITH